VIRWILAIVSGWLRRVVPPITPENPYPWWVWAVGGWATLAVYFKGKRLPLRAFMCSNCAARVPEFASLCPGCRDTPDWSRAVRLEARIEEAK